MRVDFNLSFILIPLPSTGQRFTIEEHKVCTYSCDKNYFTKANFTGEKVWKIFDSVNTISQYT